MERIKMTKAEAIEMFEAEVWKGWSKRQRAVFQMRCKRLIMPFDVFHEAIEKMLGRSVFTHEFGLNYEGIWSELMGQSEPPTLQEIIEMVPEEKRIVLVME